MADGILAAVGDRLWQDGEQLLGADGKISVPYESLLVVDGQQLQAGDKFQGVGDILLVACVPKQCSFSPLSRWIRSLHCHCYLDLHSWTQLLLNWYFLETLRPHLKAAFLFLIFLPMGGPLPNSGLP